MVNIELHDLRLECQLCGEIKVLTAQEQAAIVAELKAPAARKIIDCEGCGKTAWSLGRGVIGEEL
jgi:uncharacterized protein with PIN domain